jgi:hypothetical protein
MLIAERRTDGAMAKTVLGQIEAAITTAREGGDAPTAANFEAQVPKARSLVQNLDKKPDCSEAENLLIYGRFWGLLLPKTPST